jgi:parvulin-like peptidyl-prolyl isomerase
MPPTLTPEPLAATVNGQPIRLADYETEVRRCQAGYTSAGQDGADCPALALQSLVEQAVIEQTAAASGVTVNAAEIDEALARVQQGLGSPEAYRNWLAANFYTDETFREALRRDQLRARMAAQVASVGEAGEQVHALMILVADEATANRLLDELNAGADFATLALNHSLDPSSRAAGGDLGWFPRGLLTMPEVEAAAFALQPGQTSSIVRSALGFHIVRTLERDPVRPLSPNAQQALQGRAYQTWLEGLLAKADIQKFVNP